MMKQYIVDAFTDQLFCGNPAAVCILQAWISDDLMQKIAEENHLSETAFAVKEGEKYHLRWFTPGGEIDLCGHATLATAFVLLSFVEKTMSQVMFSTMSGDLKVIRNGKLYEMNFPAYQLKRVAVTDEMEDAIGIKPLEAYMARDLLCVLPSEADVLAYTPDMEKAKALDGLLLHTTAKGGNATVDCISRSYAPKLNVAEDPVCGSGHCHIVPYWASQLSKKEITAYQASKRGGTLYCRVEDDRIVLAGEAALFAESELYIDY